MRDVPSTQRLCANACRTSGQGGKTRVLSVVWRVVLSASDERITRIGRRKAFRNLGSRGVGAPRVERVLAVRTGPGQPGSGWRVKEASVVEVSRLVQGLIRPSVSHVPGDRASREVEASRPQLAQSAPKPIRHSRRVMPATASQRRRGRLVSRSVQACRVRGSTQVARVGRARAPSS